VIHKRYGQKALWGDQEVVRLMAADFGAYRWHLMVFKVLDLSAFQKLS
jgi:hypothetical protein